MRRIRTPDDNIQYKLSALNGRICIISNQNLQYQLIRMDGAQIQKVPKADGSIDFKYVSLNASRESIMAVEALSAPAFVAPEYMDLRRSIMQVSVRIVSAVGTALQHASATVFAASTRILRIGVKS